MWDKIKGMAADASGRLMNWFRGCHGPDNLGLAIVIAALVTGLVDRFIGTGILTILSFALYVWALFRMFSHNRTKRWEENARFLEKWNKVKTEVSQALIRLRNIRTYKYFRCPNCKSRLRMPRGIGEKTVTCSKCKHSFTQKA
ncbi:MAG: hypothetical protein IJH38_05010 [Clostridia bacterium]|nr:hypothetical protein [Clostridia bacterium]